MRPRILLFLAILTTLLLGGHAPSPIQQGTFQRDLTALTKRGFTYRMLDNDLIELTDPMNGEKRLKSLHEPNEATLRAWAAQRGIPILEIDPNSIDTSKYTGWYTYWTEVPLSNRFIGPLIVHDFNRNGRAEVYGIYKDVVTTNAESRVYEIDSLGLPTLVHTYIPYIGASRFESDVDNDSLMEITFFYGGVFTNIEQTNTKEIPIRFNFQHDGWQGDLDPGPSKAMIGLFDKDSAVDFLYKGSEPDPFDTTMGIGKEYIAEFRPDSNNFVRVWSTQFVPGQQSTTAGFAVEDFDQDGMMDFAVTEGLRGLVFSAENTEDNSYAIVWEDSTPFVNLYYQASGDVDGDGYPEFFAAATMSNGTWVPVFEAIGNNNYSMKFLFHLLSGGTFDDPTLLTSDTDGDGKKELVIMSGVCLMVFKSNLNDDYYLWYMKREDTKDALQVYDFDHNGKQDFIISKLVLDSLGRGRFKADVYLASGVVSVPDGVLRPTEARLQQNYPNPFNPVTSVQYLLPIREKVMLNVYDLLGRHVATLADGEESPGWHTVTWSGRGASSGIYLCRLETASRVQTIKLVLVR